MCCIKDFAALANPRWKRLPIHLNDYYNNKFDVYNPWKTFKALKDLCYFDSNIDIFAETYEYALRHVPGLDYCKFDKFIGADQISNSWV